MPPPQRPVRKKQTGPSPVGAKQQEVREREAKIREELERTRRFLEEAPKKKAEVEQRRREELLTRAGRVGRIDGPIDHRFNSVGGATTPRHRPLRKERNYDQLVFVFLLILFGFVIYWACIRLVQG